MSVVLAATGLGIFLLLGIAHAVMTAQSTPTGGPMLPTDPSTMKAMHQVGGLGLAPHIESSLYRAWIGFNYSHSLGIVAIAGTLLFHAVSDFGAAVEAPWFLALVVVVPAVYFVLALAYWFDKPRDGIALGTVLLWAGVLVELL